ncbi:MAG: dUTP diphosphatase [Patescibacteria group bacterium]|nr:dUTP diphosphatase [Patescibacteria group bacterium]
MQGTKGKFIVIDGTDGSGKATQTNLLVDKLKIEGYQVEMADFPQYGAKSAGLVEEYLNGKYGSAKEVGPYRASIFYACDRYDANFKIKQWLSQGKIVIANRYVASNMAHQGGKINDPRERKHYFDWIQKLEYEIFAIPKPNINIILHVDARIAQQLVDSKGYRDYINGSKRDLHETDLQHLCDAEKIYLEIADNYPNFKLIECAQNNQIMNRGYIHKMLWQEVIKIIKPEIKFAPDFKYLHEQNTNFKIQNSRFKIQNSNHQNLKSKILNLKLERLSPTAKLPARARQNDAGLDLYSNDYYSLAPGKRIIIQTGIKIALPDGYAGLIWDKGGIAKDGIHTIAGVIDSGFRGEVTVNLVNLSHDIYNIAPGQKIAQLLIQKVEFPEIVESEIDDSTDRGRGRFGSTGMF